MRPRAAHRSLRHPRAGFSLLELLIALVIVGIMVMTVAPSLQQLLGDNRQQSAAGDVVSLARRARAAAISSGAAHMLRFTSALPNASNLGLLEMFVGMTNKCQQTPWAASILLGRLAVVDMTRFNPAGSSQPTAGDAGRQVVTLRARTVTDAGATSARTDIRICFEPDGDVYTTAADGATQFMYQRDRVQFLIARTIDGVTYGRTRQVLFPRSGSSRFE